jgi:hypothetical protein
MIYYDINDFGLIVSLYLKEEGLSKSDLVCTINSPYVTISDVDDVIAGKTVRDATVNAIMDYLKIERGKLIKKSSIV